MKTLVRAGIVVFGLLALLALSASLTRMRALYLRGAAPDGTPRRHFALYLPDNRNSFFAGIIRGAERAAAETGAALSLHGIDPASDELEFASYTSADGAVVCPYLDDAVARRQLERLTARRIPLVLINHNIPHDKPWPYIGTNNFDVGRRMGAIAGRLSDGPLRPAVVYSDKAPGIAAERELIEMGISAALEGRLSAPILGLRTNMNPLDAEEVVYSLFRTTPRINTVIFTDANDTIAAAQVLIDMNLVGRVRIIGFGDDPGILEHIRKGIVAGSIVINPEKIGYEAIRSLAELHATGYTSTSVDTGIDVIDGRGL